MAQRFEANWGFMHTKGSAIWLWLGLAVVVNVAVAVYRRRKKQKNSFDDREIFFLETFVTGRSLSSRWRRLFYARNFLNVLVNDQFLCITPFFPNFLPGIIDLEQMIPLEKINSLEECNHLFGKWVIIRFQTPEGLTEALELKIRKPGQFFAVLKRSPHIKTEPR